MLAEERLRELSLLFSLRKRRIWWNLTAVYSYITRENQAKLIPELWKTRTRGNRPHLIHR